MRSSEIPIFFLPPDNFSKSCNAINRLIILLIKHYLLLQTGMEGEIPENGLRFFFYQRVFLRAAMRYRYVYMVFPRAYSKSFLSVLVLMCRCILYPRSKLFVTSGGKEQAAGIIKEKVSELCTLVPALERELDLRPGKTR